MKLFYGSGGGYTEADSQTVAVPSQPLRGFRKLTFDIPAKNIGALRLDPLASEGPIAIRDVAIWQGQDVVLKIVPSQVSAFHQISELQRSGDEVTASTLANADHPALEFRPQERLRLRRIFLFERIRLLLIGTVVFLAGLALSVWQQDSAVLAANALEARANQLAHAVTNSSFRKDACCCAILLLLAPAAYLPSTFLSLSSDPLPFLSGLAFTSQGRISGGYPWLDPNSGFTTQALGKLSADDWLQGIVPWWTPYTGVGMPLAGEMQASSLFLPFVLLLHFAGGLTALKITLQVIAGIATYKLLRQLDLSHFASFLGGALYELNGTFAWFAHTPIMPVAFLPVLLLGIERTFSEARQNRRGGWILIAIAIAFSIYAGFPETAFLDGLLGLVWFICRLAGARPERRLVSAMKVVAGGVIGLLLSAAIIVPFFQSLALSGMSHTVGLLTIPSSSAAAFLMPYIFGPITAFSPGDPAAELSSLWGGIGGYFGSTVLFLSVLALLGRNKDFRLRWLLAIWSALWICRAINVPGFWTLFHWIPGMDLIAVFRYSETSWEMTGAVLAAYALDDWSRHAERSIRDVVIGFALVVACGAAALWISSPLITRLLNAERHYSPWFWGSLLSAVTVLALVAEVCTRRPTLAMRLVLGTLIVVDASALFACPLLSGLRKPQVDFGPVVFLQRHLGIERFYSLGPVNPNYAAYFGIASIDHNAAPVPARWTNYIESSLDPGVNSALFIGTFPPPMSAREAALRIHLAQFEDTAVKYVITSGDDPFASSRPPQATPVYRDANVSIFELLHAKGYFETQGGPCKLFAKSRETILVSCQTQAKLIRRELFYPGWHAVVNGRETPLRSMSIFQMIDLPAGDVSVRFVYRPSHLTSAYAAAALGLVLLSIGAAREFRSGAGVR